MATTTAVETVGKTVTKKKTTKPRTTMKDLEKRIEVLEILLPQPREEVEEVEKAVEECCSCSCEDRVVALEQWKKAISPKK